VDNHELSTDVLYSSHGNELRVGFLRIADAFIVAITTPNHPDITQVSLKRIVINYPPMFFIPTTAMS